MRNCAEQFVASECVVHIGNNLACVILCTNCLRLYINYQIPLSLSSGATIDYLLSSDSQRKPIFELGWLHASAVGCYLQSDLQPVVRLPLWDSLTLTLNGCDPIAVQGHEHCPSPCRETLIDE